MAANRETILDKALNRGGIPSLSPLAMRLVELAADEKAGAGDLVKVIEKDPGLTARLLRMVNSPHYRRGSDQVTSVSRAVVLMGFEEIRFMSLSMGLKNTLPVSTFGPDYHLFWRTSVHRAVLARQTAEKVGLKNPEEAFTAGLVQEMGLPMLLMVLDPGDLEGFPGFHVSLEDQASWAGRAFGITHRELGRLAMESWGLPATLVDCQAPVPLGADGDHDPLPLLADFARRAAESFFAPGTELTDIHLIGERRFGMGDDQVNQLLTGSLIDAGEIADAMDIELDFQADMARVMEKAGMALARLKEELRGRIKRMAAAEKKGGKLARQDLAGLAGGVKSVGGLLKNLADHLEKAGQMPETASETMDDLGRLERVLADIEVLLSRR